MLNHTRFQKVGSAKYFAAEKSSTLLHYPRHSMHTLLGGAFESLKHCKVMYYASAASNSKGIVAVDVIGAWYSDRHNGHSVDDRNHLATHPT